MRSLALDMNGPTKVTAASGAITRVGETTVARDARWRATLTPEERTRFERYLSEIFSRLGMHWDTPGTRQTPGRWLRAMIEMTAGYDGDPKIEAVFPGECPTCQDQEMEQVVEGPIAFFALCEHHALPIRGYAWVGYLTGAEILGISKLTRIVRLHARRFTTQERITHDVASHLMKLIRPQGVAVYLEAHHACTQARGVQDVRSTTRTYAARGAYNATPRLRDEFMALAGLRRRGT